MIFKFFRKRNHFRTHKKSGHPHYIYEKIGNDYKAIGITHAEITRGIKNIPLAKNPDPKDKRKAYARTKSIKADTAKFKNKKKKGWRLSHKDKKKIKPYK